MLPAEILESFLSQCQAWAKSAGQQCKAAFKPGAQSKVGTSMKADAEHDGHETWNKWAQAGRQTWHGHGIRRGLAAMPNVFQVPRM